MTPTNVIEGRCFVVKSFRTDDGKYCSIGHKENTIAFNSVIDGKIRDHEVSQALLFSSKSQDTCVEFIATELEISVDEVNELIHSIFRGWNK